MVQILFDPSSTRLPIGQTGEGFYEGRVFQRGRGGFGYAGRHTGEGIGDVMRGIWRYLRPMAAGAAKSIGREAAETRTHTYQSSTGCRSRKLLKKRARRA
jgi:hypothetical protein